MYIVKIKERLPTLNQFIAAMNRNRFIANKMKSKWQKFICLSMNKQIKGKNVKFETPLFFIFTWIEKDRRRDKDNICGFARKIIFDAMIENGYISNDGWKEIAGWEDRFTIDKNDYGIDIKIIENFEDKKYKSWKMQN